LPWNVIILLAFHVPVHFFDVIFRICDTCDVKQYEDFLPMIPESYENEHSILLIFTFCMEPELKLVANDW